MLKDIAPKPRPGKVARARQLRGEMSLPEVMLWRELRKRPGGVKFRRQHPSGAYILDFYCSDARLAIEIDGAGHDFGDRPTADAARDQWFAAAGVTTFRVPASFVLKDFAQAVTAIMAQVEARLPLHHPAVPGGPPPRDKLGED